jgi:uncharacterized membrane protein YagU involved in acid resistance
MATTPIEIELAFFKGVLSISVKIGITIMPPPSPDKEEISPATIPMMGK